jgi:glycosyltransferase involved in cell wall biosynthesis
MNGISIIICTHNGQNKIGPTLRHIANLRIPENVSVDLIFVDNGSSDKTVQVATQLKSDLSFPFPFVILSEIRPGKHMAMITGLKESDNQYFLLCDDDNWLEKDYLTKLNNIIKTNSHIGAIGGKGFLPPDASTPDWFEEYKGIFAVGPQEAKSGILTANNNTLWGAGTLYNKKVWDRLVEMNYQFNLSTFRGASLMGGSDTEFSLILRIIGYNQYYSEELHFIHDFNTDRLTEDFLERRFYAFGRSRLYTNAYLHVMKDLPHPQSRLRYPLWIDKYRYLRTQKKTLRNDCNANPNLSNRLKLRSMEGEIHELLQLRSKYNAVFDRVIKLSDWTRNSTFQH